MSATPASMLHVVSTGLQDRERLNTPKGAPSIQNYRHVLRKRTRWASQWRRIEFDGTPEFGEIATCTIPIQGELMASATLVVVLPDILTVQGENPAAAFAWTNAIGHVLCVNTQFLIGSEIVDQIDSRHLEVIDEQNQGLENFTTTNTLISRNPSNYSDQETLNGSQPNPLTVAITPPFWWNRGPGPHAFPIQAVHKDKVQLRVNFRCFREAIYTRARYPDGSMVAWQYGKSPQITDAYWIIEYVSLEDREATAYRRAVLDIPIEQHRALEPQNSDGNEIVRFRLDQSGLVRDLTWVAQRVEAINYNAHYLFSRDLRDPKDPSRNIWWPDASGVSVNELNYGRGRIIPAFATRDSDPIVSAAMTIRGLPRFDHNASVFRSLIPALNCARTPLVDRYIYRYDFGYWPTGGLTDALGAPDEIRGCANWDMLPKMELELKLDTSTGGSFTVYAWVTRYNRLRIVDGRAAVLFNERP